MEMRDYLKRLIRPGQKIAVLGVGSTLRSDDAAGMYFIELLESLVNKENVLLIAGSTAPENFTGVIKNFAPDILFIVDAAHVGGAPGEARVIPVEDISGISFSTHMLPLPVLLKYLEAEVPCEVICIGIQPKCTEAGFSLSEEVREGTERLAEDFYCTLITV
ncbi:MAG: hydrogenase maturation peptidase HycI [Dethiobacteria bacterium]